jgi:hypothetical protein
LTEPVFPSGLTPDRRIGEGRRSVVYRAEYRDEFVAVKIYRPDFVGKYREKYGVNIAEFELARNRAVRNVPGLQPFTACPIDIIGLDGSCSLGFVQEFIEGVSLVDLGRKKCGLPKSVLDAGEMIVSRAETAGLHDLDLYYRNILLRKDEDGTWLPVLHDFNLMPQHEFPPNPFLALAYRVGIRKKSHRDRRCIRQWREFSDACIKNN